MKWASDDKLNSSPRVADACMDLSRAVTSPEADRDNVQRYSLSTAKLVGEVGENGHGYLIRDATMYVGPCPLRARGIDRRASAVA